MRGEKHLLFISGLSGSGKSSAARVLEDAGYWVIDNLPIPLIKDLLDMFEDQAETGRSATALVIDARNAAYLHLFPGIIAAAESRGYTTELLYMEASAESLQRRYSESRRPHPLGKKNYGIAEFEYERTLLQDIAERATNSIDTSDLTPNQLRNQLTQMFAAATEKGPHLHLTTFGFKYGIPTSADLLFDVRFLANPYFSPDLRQKTGLDEKVRQFVLTQPEAEELLQWLEGLFEFLIPLQKNEGKRYLNIAVGCTGGRHRSVAVACELANRLGRKLGTLPELHHRDIGRS